MRFKGAMIAGISSGFLILALGLYLPNHSASAQPQTAECYRFKSHDLPIAAPSPEERSEIWCYRHLNEPSGATMIFQIDSQGRTTPELSFIVESDGSITHASLLQGNLSVHNVRGNFTPIPVPLTPPADAERVPMPLTPTSLSSSDSALKVLTTSHITHADISLKMSGQFEAATSPSMLPWRGYWFPYSSGRLHYGKESTLAKFDRIIEARTGTRGTAQSWESRNHYADGVPWAGHCNGWAAAAIMRKEPSKPWTDPVSGITLSVGEQKGLLIERDYCPKFAFFGHRYVGPQSEFRDIHADLFHKTVRYYLGELGKPLLVDVMAHEPVENRVISGYKMQIANVGTNSFIVTMKATIHTYDLKLTDDQGTAPSEVRTYKYQLWTDHDGNITSGAWISANPDFLWMPLAPGRECKSTNPAVTEAWVSAFDNENLPLPWK
jgi:hypothetical protein